VSPLRTLDPRGSSSGGICPNVACFSRIPLGAGPEGLGPSSDHVLVESCSEDLVPKPSDDHKSVYCSASAYPHVAPQPLMVSAFLDVVSPNDENPQDCNEGTVGVSASPSSLSWVQHLAHVVPSLGTSPPPVHSIHLHSTLAHYPDFNNAASCPLLADDLEHTRDILKLCIIGYVTGKFLGYTTLNNLISSVWKCFAKLTVHDSRWLIYIFHFEADKLVVPSRGPYSVFGRPLVLKFMTIFFLIL